MPGTDGVVWLTSELQSVLATLRFDLGDGAEFESVVQDALKHATGRPYILVTDRTGASV